MGYYRLIIKTGVYSRDPDDEGRYTVNLNIDDKFLRHGIPGKEEKFVTGEGYTVYKLRDKFAVACETGRWDDGEIGTRFTLGEVESFEEIVGE